MTVLVASADTSGPLEGKKELKTNESGLKFSVKYGDFSESLGKVVGELEKVRYFFILI